VVDHAAAILRGVSGLSFPGRRVVVLCRNAEAQKACWHDAAGHDGAAQLSAFGDILRSGLAAAAVSSLRNGSRSNRSFCLRHAADAAFDVPFGVAALTSVSPGAVRTGPVDQGRWHPRIRRPEIQFRRLRQPASVAKFAKPNCQGLRATLRYEVPRLVTVRQIEDWDAPARARIMAKRVAGTM
jgi:hypothetical protein